MRHRYKDCRQHQLNLPAFAYSRLGPPTWGLLMATDVSAAERPRPLTADKIYTWDSTRISGGFPWNLHLMSWRHLSHCFVHYHYHCMRQRHCSIHTQSAKLVTTWLNNISCTGFYWTRKLFTNSPDLRTVISRYSRAYLQQKFYRQKIRNVDRLKRVSLDCWSKWVEA